MEVISFLFFRNTQFRKHKGCKTISIYCIERGVEYILHGTFINKVTGFVSKRSNLKKISIILQRHVCDVFQFKVIFQVDRLNAVPKCEKVDFKVGLLPMVNIPLTMDQV